LENATSVSGKIVYIHLIPISYMTTVKKLQESGAIGVLTAEPGCKWRSTEKQQILKIFFCESKIELSIITRV
jgi:hypothetical protein